MDAADTPSEQINRQEGNIAPQHERKKTDFASRSSIRHLATSASVSGDYTLHQVQNQVEAFGCAAFEIGILPPKHRVDLKAQAIRIFSALQLVTSKVIQWLKRMNAMGYDIYCRPAAPKDGMRYPLIFVDDLSAEKVERMKLAGLPVAVLVESSNSNFHGWVRVGDELISAEEALCAARSLSVLFGGDPGAVSSRQFGRLAGFTNKKLKHEVSDRAPFSMLRASTAEVAPEGPKFLEIVRASIRRAAPVVVEQVSAGRRRAASNGGEEDSDRAAAAFLLARTKIRVFRNDGTADESAADFGAAAAMIDDGWDPSDVCFAVLQASPNIGARHHDVGDYAARTIAAVVQAARHKTSSRTIVPVLRPRG